MTEEEKLIAKQKMLEEIAANEAEEKAHKRKMVKTLIGIGIVMLVVIIGGYIWTSRDIEPDVYYLEDGRTIDYNRMIGKIQASGKFDQVYKFKNDYAIVEKNGKQGLINVHGDIIVPMKYDWIDYFDQLYPGMAKVMVGNKYGLVGKDGKEIVKPIYDDIGTFQDNLAPVKKDGKDFYIDKKGKEVYE